MNDKRRKAETEIVEETVAKSEGRPAKDDGHRCNKKKISKGRRIIS